MKFLLDENIPPSLCEHLAELGHQARHVNKIGFNHTEDVLIFELAAKNDETIITHDNDFGILHAFSGKSRPSVILFRLQKVSTEILFEILKKNLPEMLPDLDGGAFVSIDEYSIRIRELPINKDALKP